MADTGISASASFIPAAGSHAAGDVVGGVQELVFRYANGSVVRRGALIRILSSVFVIDQTFLISGEGIYTLQMYSSAPPTVRVDNDPWTMTSADLPFYLGSLAMGMPVDLGACLYIKTPYADAQDVKLVGTSIFGELTIPAIVNFNTTARQVFLYGIVV